MAKVNHARNNLTLSRRKPHVPIRTPHPRHRSGHHGLQFPPAIHIAVTLRHTQPGVPERFLADLADAVEEVRDQPPTSGGMAPIYGMAASIPFRGMVNDILQRYMDLLYKVPKSGRKRLR